MSTVEMEVFSNSQLVVLTILMLVGGEVFTSMLELYFRKIQPRQKVATQVESINIRLEQTVAIDDNNIARLEFGITRSQSQISCNNALKYSAIGYLAKVFAGFLLVVHACGSLSIFLYLSVISSARGVLKEKGIHLMTFSVFTSVSSFSNCGFIPTNENMMVFRKNSGLLLLIIPQILVGNTMFAPCLRFLIIWVLERTTRRVELEYVLKNTNEIGFHHLLSSKRSLLLVVTVVAFIVIQLILICSMEWSSQAFSGMNSYQKFIGALFVSVNSRHAGESTINLATLNSAILVLFVVMMYLPPYTTFMPFEEEDEELKTRENEEKEGNKGLLKILMTSQVSYLAIFVVLVCMTERRKLVNDPLNFNVFNIVVEVISAYGNVGFSMGYSCSLQLTPDSSCKDAWYGFAGKWSVAGKLVLIFVMLYGRLKRFSIMNGGKAWKLS